MNSKTIHEYYELLAGESSVGAGSAAATAALLGAGVLQKAARQLAQEDIAARIAVLAKDMEQYITDDAVVMQEALPKLLSMRPGEDDTQWNSTLEKAAAVPQKLMTAALQVLELARQLAAAADMNILCDIRSGALLCRAALESGALLTDMNLSLVSGDFAEKEAAFWQLEDKQNQADELLDDIMRLE